MARIRRDKDVHAEDGGWFSSRRHFSFGGYQDPEREGLGPLRVLNDDALVPGAVWPMHPHQDVEAITYVVEGELEHVDSLGGAGRLTAGGVQRMTLGSGAQHAERNGSRDQQLRFLQIWVLPDAPALPPSVERQQHAPEDRADRLLRIVGPASEETPGVVRVHQDAALLVASLSPGTSVTHRVAARRGAYLYVIDGLARLGGEEVSAGDAAETEDPETLEVTAIEPTELAIVDVTLEWAPVGVWATRTES